MRRAVDASTWPTRISSALIGSCTNSSYEDLSRAASLAKQARKAGLRPRSEFLIGPGSEEIRSTVDRDGILGEFEKSGALLLANACGACVGQWERPTLQKGEQNTSGSAAGEWLILVLSSFNRNFTGRQDGNPATHSFVASPEIVTAMAFAGDLSFNPLIDTIPLPNGGTFRFSPPEGPALPASYNRTLEFYVGPTDKNIEVKVDPSSHRLQLIKPFPAWDGKDAQAVDLLIKIRGKCSTWSGRISSDT